MVSNPTLWLPIIGALLTVMGGVAGVLLAQKLQRTTQREHASWQHRLTVYGDFLAATDEAALQVIAKRKVGAILNAYEAMVPFWSKMHQVILVAPHDLTAIATQLGDIVRRLGEGDPVKPDPRAFMNLKLKFTELARADLGSEAIDFPRITPDTPFAAEGFAEGAEGPN
jgi:hypothetical protein